MSESLSSSSPVHRQRDSTSSSSPSGSDRCLCFLLFGLLGPPNEEAEDEEDVEKDDEKDDAGIRRADSATSFPLVSAVLAACFGAVVRG